MNDVLQTPIAIVGMACRFPGAPSVDDYWKMLCGGVDAISEVPADRWALADFYDADPTAPGKATARWGGFIDGIDRFDASFFGISPREAAAVSPLQRLLLEVSWEAVENASIAMADLSRVRTGVFVGVASFDYYDRVVQDPASVDGYLLTGNAYSVAANRLSYTFDLRGPSLAIDTACSSSLVAIHVAAQSLASGECSVALAGGAQALLSPWVTVAASKGEFLAKDGRCKTFDDSADGYVRGEGVGVLVLKRLDDALRDRDPIWAVLRGSASNQDGRSNGLTAPNPTAQVDVIATALQRAGMSPDQLGYVEAHGTGTRLGDTMELNALGSVLGRRATPCFVGSVKTNFGHLEAAAGVAGFIKAVLSLHHERIVPNLHFNRPNALVDFERLPLVVPTEVQPWAEGSPRVAGISSFGIGGTNAHVIVEAHVAEESDEHARIRRPAVLCLSARSDSSLANLAERYAAWLRQHPEVAPVDIEASIERGRSVFSQRRALVIDSPQNGIKRLDEIAAELRRGQSVRPRKRQKPRTAFLFTGQGAQYRNMGAGLRDHFPAFRRVWERADALLFDTLGRSLSDVVYANDASDDELTQTLYTQSALYVLQAGIVDVLAEYDIRPAFVLGHSVGEFAAAYCSGILTFEDGLRLVGRRAAAMQACAADGAMLAASMDRETAVSLIERPGVAVVIAAYNGPRNVVFSGSVSAIEGVEKLLARDGIETRRLDVSHAFHSHSMMPAAFVIDEAARAIAHAKAQIPMVSTVSAEMIEQGVDWPQYWAMQLLRPVDFERAALRLAQENISLAIEVGPKPVLTRLSLGVFSNARSVGALDPPRDDVVALLEAVGASFEAGSTLRPSVRASGTAPRLRLPTYAFDAHLHQLYPPVTPHQSEAHGNQGLQHAFLSDCVVNSPNSDEVTVSLPLGSRRFGYLGDHTVLGADILPATGFIELAQAAAFRATGNDSWRLEKLEFRRPLIIEEEDRVIRIKLTRSAGESAWHFTITDGGDAGTVEAAAIYSRGVLHPSLVQQEYAS